MPNRINELLLEEYKSKYQDAGSVIAIGYEGLTVEKTNELRNQLAAKDVRLSFVKNRLVNLAFKQMDRPEVMTICNGQTAFADGEDPVSIARMLVDFSKENTELKLHGALVENTILDSEGVKELSKSPTKEELKAKIVGQALGPGAELSAALLGPAKMLAGQVKSLVEKLEEGDAA